MTLTEEALQAVHQARDRIAGTEAELDGLRATNAVLMLTIETLYAHLNLLGHSNADIEATLEMTRAAS